MKDLKGRDLKGIADFTKEEIEYTLEVAKLLKQELKIGKPHRLLEGKSLGGVFETPSTRTSISFETAMTQLGGHMLWLDQNRLWVGEAAEEDWHDTVKTLSRYLDGIAYRAVRRDRLESAAEYADIPLINASCPVEHPCQAFRGFNDYDRKEGACSESEGSFLLGLQNRQPSCRTYQFHNAECGQDGIRACNSMSRRF